MYFLLDTGFFFATVSFCLLGVLAEFDLHSRSHPFTSLFLLLGSCPFRIIFLRTRNYTGLRIIYIASRNLRELSEDA